MAVRAALPAGPACPARLARRRASTGCETRRSAPSRCVAAWVRAALRPSGGLARVIVGDTSWIVALRDPQDAHHAAAVAIVEAIGDEPVLIAVVTLTECLVAPAKLGLLDEAEGALRSAFDVEDADESAPRRWASRRAGTGLRLPDAIVLETALHHHARGVATFDERLAACCRAADVEVLGGPDPV